MTNVTGPVLACSVVVFTKCKCFLVFYKKICLKEDEKLTKGCLFLLLSLQLLLVNLRYKTGEERRLQTLSDKRDNNQF